MSTMTNEELRAAINDTAAKIDRRNAFGGPLPSPAATEAIHVEHLEFLMREERRRAASEVDGKTALESAAHELLKALELVVEGYGYSSFLDDEEKNDDPDIIKARAAIAKAKGELTSEQH